MSAADERAKALKAATIDFDKALILAERFLMLVPLSAQKRLDAARLESVRPFFQAAKVRAATDERGAPPAQMQRSKPWRNSLASYFSPYPAATLSI